MPARRPPARRAPSSRPASPERRRSRWSTALHALTMRRSPSPGSLRLQPMPMRFLLLVCCLLAGLPACGRDVVASAASGAPLVFLGDRNLAPYEFESGGEARGSNIDIARAIGAAMGRPVEVRLYEWSQAQRR